MKNISSKLLTITIIGFSAIATSTSSLANEFSEQEVDRDRFIAVAIPYGYKKHKLEIIEQIPGQQQCWNESGISPVAVDLLLLNFDHTDSCRRIKDSNGYSIRIDGKEEKSSLYLIDIVQRNGELQLVAKHENPNLPELLIGRSNGLGEGALKIFLNPGWKVTKRNYQGNTLGHVYLSGDSQTILANNPANSSGESSTDLPQPSPEVAGTFQIFESDLSGCEPGNYDVSGQFDPSFTQLTITQAPGAEGCFDALPTQVFNTPGLTDGGEPVVFTSNAAPGQGQMNGSVRRVYGSFATPITYPGAKDTIGLLAINSQNIVVRDPTGETINENTTILTNIPAPPEKPIAEVLPDLLPAASSIDKQIRDTRSGSDTEGMLVVRDKLRVVFDDDTTVEEVNTALKAIGSGIIGSYENGTAVTLKIPDTGDLKGIDIVEGILSTQPSVVTTVPVIINEVPSKINTSGISSQDSTLTALTTPCPIPIKNKPNPGQVIPRYLQVTRAFNENKSSKKPERLNKPLIGNQPNIFVVDAFSEPIHDDVNLVNPIRGISDRDPDNHPNVALFDKCSNLDMFATKGQPNFHGFVVSGILAAKESNNYGVVGMYPADENTKIFALNFRRDNWEDNLLYALETMPGNHVVNLSMGLTPPSESVSLREGIVWFTQIRQRRLTNRVVLVQSAGNYSNRQVGKIIPAEHNGYISAAALVGINQDEKEEDCYKVFGQKTPVCTETRVNKRGNIRLSNALVVESLNAVTGKYANDSNQVSDETLRVRAIGESSDPNCRTENAFFVIVDRNKLFCTDLGGTSYAAPQVAGLAAWIWGRDSDLTASQVVKLIRDSQTEFPLLDSKGNFVVDGSGNPKMSDLKAINVLKTFTAENLQTGLSATENTIEGSSSQGGLIIEDGRVEGSSCPEGKPEKLGKISVSSSFESKPSTSSGGIVTGTAGGFATQYSINANGIIQPGTANQQDIKPVLYEFGYDPDEFLAGEYDDPIEVNLGFDDSLESIKLLEIPEPCQ